MSRSRADGPWLLYEPQSEHYDSAPLHLHAWSIPPHEHPPRLTWHDDVFERIKPVIESVRVDNKGPGKEAQNFAQFLVTEWNLFAKAIGLES